MKRCNKQEIFVESICGIDAARRHYETCEQLRILLAWITSDDSVFVNQDLRAGTHEYLSSEDERELDQLGKITCQTSRPITLWRGGQHHDGHEPALLATSLTARTAKHFVRTGGAFGHQADHPTRLIKIKLPAGSWVIPTCLLIDRPEDENEVTLLPGAHIHLDKITPTGIHVCSITAACPNQQDLQPLSQAA